jgi:hypothetical protein
VGGAGRVDAQGASGDGTVLIPLAASEDEDVLVAIVVVPGNMAGLMITQQGSGRSSETIAIKPMNLHSFPEKFPG